jgi:peroxiredoxin
MSTPLNIKPGDKLPPATLTAQLPDGGTADVALGELGRPCVLYFYPKADTGG